MHFVGEQAPLHGWAAVTTATNIHSAAPYFFSMYLERPSMCRRRERSAGSRTRRIPNPHVRPTLGLGRAAPPHRHRIRTCQQTPGATYSRMSTMLPTVCAAIVFTRPGGIRPRGSMCSTDSTEHALPSSTSRKYLRFGGVHAMLSRGVAVVAVVTMVASCELQCNGRRT